MELDINNVYEDKDVYDVNPSHFAQIIHNLNTGIWQYNVNTKETKWSAGLYKILGYEPGEITGSYNLFIEHLIHPEDKDSFLKLENPPLHIRLLTKSEGYQWYEVIVKKYNDGPSYLRYGLLIHIHKYKLALLKAEQDQKSIALLEDQNKRLQNFAYIASHNLRTYAGNLKSMIDIYENSQLNKRPKVFAHIQSVSDSLSATIGHLDEIVSVQLATTEEKKTIDISALFKNITSLLHQNIQNCDARIVADFSECPEIEYVPAYLESIFQNLLTNALKYRDADRPLVIKCYSYKQDANAYLTFEDNGIGINLERYGEQIFGMYKTFHDHNDARGIGLFITRNQVESLGGSINIESTVGVGTKFTIRLT